ncbi:MAG: RraA family protein [Betaproteobacteria bacterium]|nr:RraA family protein [Betaproteobacteria bacterium]
MKRSGNKLKQTEVKKVKADPASSEPEGASDPVLEHDKSALDSKTLKLLQGFDTPTICNALEIVAPERRLFGYTVESLLCIYPELPPMVGFARTCTIRSAEPSQRDPVSERDVRVNWYRYVDEGGPKPSVVVMQDLDGQRAGFGSFWGEVNSHVHRGLGSLGVITNGCIRDVPMNASGFQMLAGSVKPSHAHVHVVEMGGAVSVCGMSVRSGDLIHADLHGAVVIPQHVAGQIAKAVKLLSQREAVIIGASKRKGFNWQVLRDALEEAADIH